MQEIDADQFDKCARDLETKGYALLPLPQKIRTSISKSFETARTAIRSIAAMNANNSTINVPTIDPETDSANWTGYHCAASRNGRYNKFREGFVFSNGEMFDVECQSCMNSSDQEQLEDFRSEMNDMFHIMHNVIANGILQTVERRLQLPQYHFRDAMGPTDKSSQWHLKRYDVNSFSDLQGDQMSNEILPVHTDPSLISVVILDVPGVNAGGFGLQVFDPNISMWKEIMCHGHDIAIIFLGSVLSHLTKSQLYPAAKHKVVQWWSDGSPLGRKIDSIKHERVAATLFLRPHGDALMQPLPSPLLQFDTGSVKKCVTFRQWNARVARNYMRKKKQAT